ncbi:MAG: PASTA domain-containing protein [Gordonibacter pamelaeae]
MLPRWPKASGAGRPRADASATEEAAEAGDPQTPLPLPAAAQALAAGDSVEPSGAPARPPRRARARSTPRSCRSSAWRASTWTRTATSSTSATSTTLPPAGKGRQAAAPSAAVTADLSGLDECLVDSGYTPPAAAWRSGDTMEMPRVEGKAAPKQKEFRAPDPREKKHGRGRVVAIVIVLLLAAAAAAAGITYQMELWGGKVVPDVAGMTQADATYQLEGKGFTVRATQVKSDEMEGLVLLTDPGPAGAPRRAPRWSSTWRCRASCPDVVGKTRDEAAKLLEAEDFARVTFAEEKSDTAEGTVLSVTPEAGEKAKASTDITVTVAVPFTVPDVANQPLDAAKAALQEASYVPEVAYYYTEDVPEGTVVGTSPAAGEKLASGSSVTVNVAMSRASVLVPAAKDYLSSIGTISLGGTTYEIVSVDDVKYTGYNQTSFTVTAAAVTTLDGETVRGSAKQKSGTIVWDDSDNVVSIS